MHKITKIDAYIFEKAGMACKLTDFLCSLTSFLSSFLKQVKFIHTKSGNHFHVDRVSYAVKGT